MSIRRQNLPNASEGWSLNPQPHSQRILLATIWTPIILIIGALCLWLIHSEERLFVDEWSVQVVDQSQTPLAGIRVSESCADYTVDWRAGGDFFTNAQGEVKFPRYSMRATHFYWAVAPILSRIDQGFHASSGLYAMVSVSDPRMANGSDSCHCHNEECRRGPMHSVIQVALRASRIGRSN